MRAQDLANRKLVIFDIDDTLVNTDTRVNVVKDGKIIKQLNSHDFTHYKLGPGEEFDFGAFRDAREFFTKARPIPGMIRQLKRDINTGNKVIMLTARSDFNDRDIFLDTFRRFGIDMDRVHVYRAGNLAVKAATEEKKKIILKHLLGKTHYDKIVMYDDSVPNLNAFLSLKQDYPWSKFYAWHVDPNGQADEYHRTDIKEVNSPGELAVDPDLIKRFTDAGWQIDGEGRDQIVLSKPNSKSVLKIVGQGDVAHSAEIRQYVTFFRANQRNPHFPRVGVDKTLDWKGRRYYVYTQERLLPLPGDEAVMDYLEYAMGELGHGEDPDYSRVPPGLTVEQIDGLVMAIDDMFDSGLLKQHNFDLGNVANIMQRANGQLVIVDPTTSLDNLDEDGSPGGPITAYHGTFQPSIQTFAPLSHFGTLAAARERLRFKGKKEGINQPGRIYQVTLDIERPFRVRDFAGIHSPTHFAFDLRQAGLIDQEEMLAITRLAGEAGQSRALIEKLQQLGFDGMVYRNKYEDPGSESYVILDPNQVVSVKPI